MASYRIGNFITLITGAGNLSGMIAAFSEQSITVKNDFAEIEIFADSIIGYYCKSTPNSHESEFSAAIVGKTSEPIASAAEEIIEENVAQLQDITVVAEDKAYEVSTVTEGAYDDFVEFDFDDIPWRETGTPSDIMFKGRDKLIEKLVKHYKSFERSKTYVLYGLTRTGKSSVLKFLSKRLELEEVKIEGKTYKFIPFIWDLGEASNAINAEELWHTLLHDFTISKLLKLITEKQIPSYMDFTAVRDERYRSKHMREIVVHLKKNGYFPIFLIDEFTYIVNLKEKKNIDIASILASFRKYSFDNLGCFVYAGAYNLRLIIEDSSYGLTGQLVNTIEEPVGPIEEYAARELIQAFEPKVEFTEDAIQRILVLSYHIPYFIQILCKNMALYALYVHRNVISGEDVAYVVDVLVGNSANDPVSHISRISAGVFHSNQFMPSDPKENHCLLSTIASLQTDTKHYVEYSDIQRIWADAKIPSYGHLLNKAIEDLKAKGVILSHVSNQSTSYRISVDLFRKWWHSERPDVSYELGSLLE